MNNNRVWMRWRCTRLDQLLALHIAGAGKGCVAWVAMLTEPDTRKPWAKALPEHLARLVNGHRPAARLNEIAPAVLAIPYLNPSRSAHLSGLPLLKVYLRRESGEWWELSVKNGSYQRGTRMVSQRLLAACEGKYLNSL